MSEYIKKIRTTTGDKQIDYNALANLPTLVTVDNTLSESGKAADAKVVGDTLTMLTQHKDATSLKGLAVGRSVKVEDVSPLAHEVEIEVKSKNIAVRTNPNMSVTADGITYTVNSDGTVSATGKATSTSYYLMQGSTSYANAVPIKRGKYTLAKSPIEGCRISVGLHQYNGATRVLYYSTNTNSVTFEVTNDTTRFDMILCVDTGYSVSGAVFKPQIERGNTETEYTPYTNPSTATLTYGGKTYTPNSDGSVEGLTSTYPVMEMSVTDGFNVYLEYNQDINAVIKKLTNAITALGGTI